MSQSQSIFKTKGLLKRCNATLHLNTKEFTNNENIVENNNSSQKFEDLKGNK